MEFIDLPIELLELFTNLLFEHSVVSLVVFANINKFCYNVSKKYAVANKIGRTINCCDIAKEGYLEILKWARSNGCDWNSNTCSSAARNGH